MLNQIRGRLKLWPTQTDHTIPVLTTWYLAATGVPVQQFLLVVADAHRWWMVRRLFVRCSLSSSRAPTCRRDIPGTRGMCVVNLTSTIICVPEVGYHSGKMDRHNNLNRRQHCNKQNQGASICEQMRATVVVHHASEVSGGTAKLLPSTGAAAASQHLWPLWYVVNMYVCIEY